MIKRITLVRRKPSLSHAEFRAYYEEHHAPLVASLIEGFVRYQRNYPSDERPFLPPGRDGVSVDSVTEMWFEDDAGLARYRETLDKVRPRIVEDELQFIDRDSMEAFVVDTRASEIG